MLDRQQAFDMAARGVIAQGRPSQDQSGRCRYRTATYNRRLACTVGSLIPDYRYRDAFEDEGLFALEQVARQGLAPHLGFEGHADDLAFLADLRLAHDSATGALAAGDLATFLAEFVRRMHKLAARYRLGLERLESACHGRGIRQIALATTWLCPPGGGWRPASACEG